MLHNQLVDRPGNVDRPSVRPEEKLEKERGEEEKVWGDLEIRDSAMVEEDLFQNNIQEQNGGSEDKGENVSWCGDVRAMSHHSRKPNSPYHPRHKRARCSNVGQSLWESGRTGRDHCRTRRADRWLSKGVRRDVGDEDGSSRKRRNQR